MTLRNSLKRFYTRGGDHCKSSH